MTVRDLIERLKAVDPDSICLLHDEEFGASVPCSDIEVGRYTADHSKVANGFCPAGAEAAAPAETYVPAVLFY